MTRERIYEVIERSDGSDRLSSVYDVVMMVVIATSIVPLAFKSEPLAFIVIDKAAAAVFILDYLLRWATADLKLGRGGWSYALYPITPMALVDLVSILPSLTVIGRGFKLLRLLRMMRAFRVFRVFKALRYSKSFQIIGEVLRRSRRSLVAVCVLAGGYILIAALVIYNVEPDTFANFFEAVYWATISLTTVGYGDIYPVSVMGRIITMVSSIFGVAIVALPAGIITAGYMKAIDEEEK